MEFRQVEVAISQRYARGTILSNLFFSLETAVSVGVAQRHYAALAAVGLQGNIDVSVRSDGDIRAGPIPSATTSAQKPCGSCSPPLSESQAGALAAGRLHAIASKKPAARPAAAQFLVRVLGSRELRAFELCIFGMTLYRLQDATSAGWRIFAYQRQHGGPVQGTIMKLSNCFEGIRCVAPASLSGHTGC